jgi:NADPH-dependent curcumin reductase CurA
MMPAMKNKQIILASRPTGMPAMDNFATVDAEVPQPKDGEVLVRTRYLSVDPYMRGRMSDRKSYVAPFAVNEVMNGGVVGEVMESRSAALRPGDIVTGQLGKVDPSLAPVTTALGVLGMPGLTAYFGLVDIGKPREGETVVVSGAAGAVGMTVCQIAKIKGCRVVGIAGSDKKNEYLEHELWADRTINYKAAGDMKEVLKDACPNGVNIYFDNVGGSVSDAVLPFINKAARVIICGQISLYNLEQPEVGPRPQTYLLVKSALMQGFIITDYAPRFAEGVKQLAQWLSEGKMKYAENIVDGFENTPRAFLGLFAGENLGKQLVRVED